MSRSSEAEQAPVKRKVEISIFSGTATIGVTPGVGQTVCKTELHSVRVTSTPPYCHIAQWLEHSPDTRKVPGSSPGMTTFVPIVQWIEHRFSKPLVTSSSLVRNT